MNIYFDRQLLPEFDHIKDKDEQILWAAKPKYIPFMLPVLILSVLFSLGSIFNLYRSIESDVNTFPVIVHLFLIISPIGLIYLRYLQYSYSLYAYSNKRIIIRIGIAKAHFITIDPDKLSEFELKVYWIEKKLGVGSIRFYTGETRVIQGKKEKIYYYWRTIENPDEIFKQISGYIQKHTQSELIQ